MLSQPKQTQPNKNHPDFISVHNHCLGNIHLWACGRWDRCVAPDISALFPQAADVSHTCTKLTNTHTHPGVAEVSRAVYRVNPCPFFPLLCECYRDWGAAGWSMCLLRGILFTGINALYTQASAGTLSGGTFTSRHLRGQPLKWCCQPSRAAASLSNMWNDAVEAGGCFQCKMRKKKSVSTQQDVLRGDWLQLKEEDDTAAPMKGNLSRAWGPYGAIWLVGLGRLGVASVVAIMALLPYGTKARLWRGGPRSLWNVMPLSG